MSMAHPKICVVGSANMDLLSKVPRLPVMGETLIGHFFHMGCGGKGSNQAAMAAKLGADVSMVVKLGKDPLGEITFQNYRDLGIDTRFVFWDSEHFSGVAPIVVDDQGKNMVIIVPGANMAFDRDDVHAAREAIQGAEVVVCQLEIPVETTLEAFRLAKAAGRKTILNPAPGAEIPADLYLLSDIIVPNETETEILTGLHVGSEEEARAAAIELKSRGPGVVILTLGDRGALLLDEDGFSTLPAEKVQAVDTTGAGDAFVGSLAFFIARNEPLRTAVQKANRIAAMSVMKVGTQTSFPTWEQVAAVLEV